VSVQSELAPAALRPDERVRPSGTGRLPVSHTESHVYGMSGQT